MELLLHYSLALLKGTLLLYALVFGASYITRVIHSKDITEGIAWRMGFGVAGFVTLQWLV